MTDLRLIDTPATSELPPTSEDALALAFAERFADKLRYVAKWARWLIYDGTRWRIDETWHVFDLVRGICREVALEAETAAKTVASAKTVAAVERLAKADRRLAATVDQFDAEPLLLTTANGATFDLRTGTGRAANPFDYITKKTACAAAPAGTPHPIWTTFLKRITADNHELQDFLRRYAGYCLTGLTDEHAFVFGYGTGANGKSTFINTLAQIMGDYGMTADSGTFVESRGERHPTDLASLQGSRLVVAQETEKGRRWNETRIKALTGGDTISARFMRQDPFEFKPVFKLLMSGNNKPRIGNIDEAIRRRLLLAPFTVTIPPAERDHQLADKLKTEHPAILRWAIDGCLEWQRVGLTPPKIVLDATNSYFADQDTLGQWLEECTRDGGLLAFTRIADLFASWKTWSEARNYKPGTTMALSEMLTDRGFTKKREGNTGHRGFAGLTIKPN